MLRGSIGILALAAAVGCSAGGNNGATSATSSGSSSEKGAGSGGSDGEGGGGDGGETAGISVSSATTGSGVGGFEECSGTSSTATSEKQPADIIVLVDTSGSMNEESAEVQQNLNAFAEIILGSGIDVHVVMIADANVCIPAPLGSGTCAGADSNPPIYQHVVQTVSSTDALSLILSTHPQWQGSLRPDATKTFVVVTDDNSDMSAGDFTQQLLALDPTFQGFKFMAIIAYSDPMECFGFSCPAGNPCCHEVGGFACESYAAAEGTVYQELIGQTMGLGGDLCAQQFDPIFQQLAEGVVIASELSCEYAIPPPPEGETLDAGLVNVLFTPAEGQPAIPIYYVAGGLAACGPEGGWYYDDPAAPTSIIMCPATCDVLQGGGGGAKLDVVFGCETEVGPPN